MVDPNPARGMPLPLQRYWLAGKGALKIRWRMDGDFLRCVGQLRKYFPKNPEGLCNILHQKAVGAPPGKGHPGTHSLVASMRAGNYAETVVRDDRALTAAMELLQKQPQLGEHLWVGPLAPFLRPTEEPRQTRIFEHGSLRHRMLPLPFAWRERQAQGHDGAVVVGRILGVTYGPDDKGHDYAWGWGDFLDEEVIPDAKKARHLMERGVIGSSVDPGGRVIGTLNAETGYHHVSEFTIGGATMVPIPAFSSMAMYCLDENGDWDDDQDMTMDLVDEEDCGCDEPATIKVGGLPVVRPDAEYSTNDRGWRGLPLAMREATFDNDDAVKRIAAWAGQNAGGADVERLNKAFLFHDERLPPTATTSYRFPVGDIINGRLTLVYHAIYAAAALLSGAHGGVPQIPEDQRQHIQNTISEIYAHMSREFNDPNIRAPWDRSAQPGVQMSAQFAGDVAEPYGDVTYADPGYRDKKKRYPIDTPDHVRAAWSYINQEKNAGEYSPEQLKLIKGRIMAAAKKHGIQISEGMGMEDEYSVTEFGYPIAPPKEWFEDPEFSQRTALVVTDEGRVSGHLALWNECHRDVAMRECVLAPHSETEYAAFHLGAVVTAEGDSLPVGKIVMDTRHADIRMPYASAALHYDNTGDEIAVVRAGEDEFGIWVAGSVVPEATPRKVAKLRRSPLSGDWRRERGSLELTAALAVNAPAFPVYAMENEERLALVAAGSIWPEYDEPEPFVPPTGILAAGVQAVEDFFTAWDVENAFTVEEVEEEDDDPDDRAARLMDLLEDHDILAGRERGTRLRGIFAAETEQTVAPAPSQAQVPVAPVDAAVPAEGEQPVDGESATDAAGMDAVAWQAAAENDTQFFMVKKGIGTEADAQAQAQGGQAAPAAGQAPAAPVAPVAPVAPQQPVPTQ